MIKNKITHDCIKIIISSVLPLLLCVSNVSIASNSSKQIIKKLHDITGQGEFSLLLPSDVAVVDEKVYVVDGGNHRVVVFDIGGKYLFSFGGKGTANGQMSYPVGIYVSRRHKIYVADSGNHRVQVFSASGKFQSAFKTRVGKKNIRPVDIIEHSRTGHLFITGSNNHSLMKYTHSGKFIKKWGGNGVNQGEFRYPATISELRDGRIAVVDVLNSRVQVFNLDGSVSMVVGEWGVLPGNLVRPKGVATDQKGRFYISDSYMNLVQSFSEIGSFILALGFKNKPSGLQTPVGMSIENNKLFIVEMRKHRVSVYQLVN